MEQGTTEINLSSTSSPRSGMSFAMRIILIVLILGAIVIGVGIAVLRSERLQFNHVTVSGPQTFPVSDIERFTNNYWAETKLGSIPNSTTLLFSKEKFEQRLKKEFPIIDLAYITIPDPHTLMIQIRERLPVVVWCFVDDSCGFVDNTGVIYANAPQFSEGVYPIFTSDNLSINDGLFGQRIIEPAQIDRFYGLFARLQTDEVSLSKINFASNGDMEFSIEKLFGLYPSDNARILGTVNQDDAVFLRDITTGLAQEIFRKQYLAAPKTLEYIDLRFPGKVFYKFSTSSEPISSGQ